MSNWIEVVSDECIGVVVSTYDPTGIHPTDGEWLSQPYGVGIGWTRIGSVWTGPNGEAQPVEPPPPGPTYRKLLMGAEWIELFTPAEWKWLKARRDDGTTAGDRLDQMLDSIRWLDAVNVEVGGSIDEFYNWLLNQGIPGGQVRIDELREGIID